MDPNEPKSMRPCPNGAAEPNDPRVWTWLRSCASNWPTTRSPLPQETPPLPARPWSKLLPPDKTEALSPRSGLPECPNSSVPAKAGTPYRLKPQVFHRQALVDELAQRVNPDAQMHFREVGSHLLIALRGLDTIRRHRLIRDRQQRPAWFLVVEPGDEDCRRLHVDGHAPDLPQILLQILVVLPHTAVGGVNRAGPVIAPMVADGRGDG